MAYFFVKENHEILRDANVILKTLAWQVASQDADFKVHAISICRQRSLTSIAEDTWENLFLDYYASDAGKNHSVMMIVDGLDEATPLTRRTILGFMKDLVSPSNSTQPTIQFAVIGRKSLRDDMDFRRLEKVTFIEVSRLKNKNHIDSYIRKRLEELDILHELRKKKPNGLKKANKLGSIILKKVSDGADGVFLWAKLLLDSIVKKDLTQIEEALANPPTTLDEMIRSVFERLDKDDELDHNVLRKMLLFLTYARRPLSFGELNAAVSLPSRKPRILLWKHTRGKLSSVLDLIFLRDVDPDLQHVSDDTDNDATQGGVPSVGRRGSDTRGEAPFDFTENDYDSISSIFSDEDDDGDTFSTIAERAHAQHLPGQSEGSHDIFSHLRESQLQTQITFCHARIGDYLVREGNSKERKQSLLSIVPAVEDAQVEMTVTCLEMLELASTCIDYSIYLCDYPLCHLPFHLESVDRTRPSHEVLVRVLEDSIGSSVPKMEHAV